MMTGDEHGPIPEGDDLIAAEYVLGVLPEDQRATAARRIEQDTDFARLVEQWEIRLSPMAEEYEAVEAPASVKQALERQLFSGGLEEKPGSAGFWQSLALWRGIAAAALASLAVMAVFFYANLPAPTPPTGGEAQRLAAALSHDDTDIRYLVVYDGAMRNVGLSHVAGARPQGRDFELWVIEDGGAPVSLGVIPDGANVHIAVAEPLGQRIAAGAIFAISVEPLGGSPSGAPTGPVVAAGDLREI